MKKSTTSISTLFALGGSLAALPAAALELGSVKVNSSLGQPLRASIAYALAPNESIANTCVSVNGGRMHGSVPGVGIATVSIANGVISITGKSAVREPVVTMRLNVHCPYAGRISREYTMLLDPVGVAEQVSLAQTASPEPAAAATSVPASSRAVTTTARRVVRNEPVVTGTRYQVAPGETLGDIAQRIVDRPVALWPAVDGIFAANPDAFIDNDPNRLVAGSWLTIPDFGADAPLTIAASTPTQPVFEEAADFDAVAGSTYTGLTEEQSAAPVDLVEPEPEVIDVPDPIAVIEASEAVEASPAPVMEFVDIPDTELPAPETTSESPNVATAQVRPTLNEEPKSNWLAWLAGAGIGLIALLLFFGRMVRSRFGSSPIGSFEPAERRQSDSSKTLDVVSEMEEAIDENDETQENLALDADLIIGSGLQESNEVDVAQDFGFAATTHLDHELTADMSADRSEEQAKKSETDIIPPLNIEVQSILESEVLPDEAKEAEVEAEDDDYDMSVIVDATKMPNPEDATMRDLEAIPVDTGDDTILSEDYTVSSEVDYTVVEQDYEDELTATQALNEEIARAAEELSDKMDEADISLAAVAALDVTAQMPVADNDDEFVGDAEETGINPALDDQVEDGDVTAKFKSQQDKTA